MINQVQEAVLLTDEDRASMPSPIGWSSTALLMYATLMTAANKGLVLSQPPELLDNRPARHPIT